MYTHTRARFLLFVSCYITSQGHVIRLKWNESKCHHRNTTDLASFLLRIPTIPLTLPSVSHKIPLNWINILCEREKTEEYESISTVRVKEIQRDKSNSLVWTCSRNNSYFEDGGTFTPGHLWFYILLTDNPFSTLIHIFFGFRLNLVPLNQGRF